MGIVTSGGDSGATGHVDDDDIDGEADHCNRWMLLV